MKGRLDLATSPHRTRRAVLGAIGGLVVLLAGGWLVYRESSPDAARLMRLRTYWANPDSHGSWMIRAGQGCGSAPFLQPTDGLVGFMWRDSMRFGHIHQGIDIFGPTPLGETPVVAAYDGYMTRLPGWRSAVIERIPEDPLHPGRQIWLYYAHMADAGGVSYIDSRFPPGSYEVPVSAGDLLGFQGDYSGDPANPVGMHLHFSIVKDDGTGHFTNELEVRNTLDPGPYLGFDVNAGSVGETIAVCREAG
jgi:peptidoglycan LD-endopeptidase LytH